MRFEDQCQNCEFKNIIQNLALQLSPVVFGSKCAMLIGFHCWDELKSCEKYFAYETQILSLFGVKARIFAKTERMTQVYFYREELLEQALNAPIAKDHLLKMGYSEESDIALGQLIARFNPISVPHEVGFFLGYPAKDVAGYLAGEEPSDVVKGPWRIYGPEIDSSLHLMKRHQVARTAMKHLIERHGCVIKCLKTLAEKLRLAA